MTDYAHPGANLAPGPALSTLDHVLAHRALHELAEACMQRGSSSTWCTAVTKPGFFFKKKKLSLHYSKRGAFLELNEYDVGQLFSPTKG